VVGKRRISRKSAEFSAIFLIKASPVLVVHGTLPMRRALGRLFQFNLLVMSSTLFPAHTARRNNSSCIFNPKYRSPVKL